MVKTICASQTRNFGMRLAKIFGMEFVGSIETLQATRQEIDFEVLVWICVTKPAFLRTIEYIQTLKSRGVKIILFFMGTERRSYNGDFTILEDYVDLVLCEEEFIQETFNIPTSVLKVAPENLIDFEERLGYKTLFYCPNDYGNRHERDARIFDFYRYYWVVRLAKDFPKERFVIFGRNREKRKVLKNLYDFGNISDKKMKRLYRDSKIFLRLTKEDGVPFTVLESLARGCYVLFTQRMKYTTYISDYDSLKKEFTKLLRKKKPNKKASDYIHREYTEEKTRKQLSRYIKKL